MANVFRQCRPATTQYHRSTQAHCHDIPGVERTVAQCWPAATSGHGGVILLSGTIQGGMAGDCERDQDNADIITITRFKYRQLGGITDSEKQDCVIKIANHI